MWILITILFTLFLYCNGSDVETLFHNYHQLYEGSRCQLQNGAEEGVCVKAIECPEFIQQFQDGDFTKFDRCGFDDFDEIVCCALKRRPAEAACHSYMHKLKEMHDVQEILIFHGVLAMTQEFPYMVALGYPVSRQEAAGGVKYACGGTLISEKHVLTAAHCVSNIDGLIPVEVVLGTNDLDNIKSARDVQRIPISKIIKHSKFKLGLNYHDIAILELEKPVEFTAAVFPTCLMTKPLTKKNANKHTSLVIVGWGDTDSDGTMSTKLLKAENLKFVNKKRCCKKYADVRVHIPYGLDNAMICVRDPDTKRKADTCPGDSGGPLLIQSDYPFPRVVGITSFGYPCGGTKPGVYVSVYKYLDWIEDMVWPKSE